MGSASFCSVCGEVIGGWDLEYETPCQCDTGIDSNGRIVDPVKAKRAGRTCFTTRDGMDMRITTEWVSPAMRAEDV